MIEPSAHMTYQEDIGLGLELGALLIVLLCTFSVSLRGLILQGYKCSLCEIIVHGTCLPEHNTRCHGQAQGFLGKHQAVSCIARVCVLWWMMRGRRQSMLNILVAFKDVTLFIFSARVCAPLPLHVIHSTSRTASTICLFLPF